MDGIISYKMCAVKVRNAKLRNYLKEGAIISAAMRSILAGILSRPAPFETFRCLRVFKTLSTGINIKRKDGIINLLFSK